MPVDADHLAAAGWRSRVRWADLGLAVALGTGALVTTEAGRRLGPQAPWLVHPGWPASVVVLAMTIAPVATRRRFPVASLAVATVGLGLTRLLHVPEAWSTSIAVFLVFQATGRWAGDRLRNAARLLSAVLLLGVLAWSVVQERRHLSFDVVPEGAYYLAATAGITLNLAYLAAAWWLGEVDRGRAQRERELATRTSELELEREENTRKAVLSERLRIAREIHDVVAHHVSVMGIQAGAARRVLGSEPAGATEPLQSIESSSRAAVTELNRLLALLRSDGESDSPSDRQPLPGLTQLSTLRRQLADAGLACSFGVTGEERALAPAVDLSAYRIIQESLTNVLKHAGVDRAELSLGYEPDALVVTVTNRRRTHRTAGSSQAAPGHETAAGTVAGNGIRGMGERAALVGGHLTAGPTDDGGFVVRARLPYEGRARA